MMCVHLKDLLIAFWFWVNLESSKWLAFRSSFCGSKDRRLSGDNFLLLSDFR
jgi:hypothetical protein